MSRGKEDQDRWKRRKGKLKNIAQALFCDLRTSQDDCSRCSKNVKNPTG